MFSWSPAIAHTGLSLVLEVLFIERTAYFLPSAADIAATAAAITAITSSLIPSLVVEEVLEDEVLATDFVSVFFLSFPPSFPPLLKAVTIFPSTAKNITRKRSIRKKR